MLVLVAILMLILNLAAVAGVGGEGVPVRHQQRVRGAGVHGVAKEPAHVAVQGGARD